MTRGGSPYVTGAEGCIGLIGLGAFWIVALVAVVGTIVLLSGGSFFLAAVVALLAVALLWVVLGGHIDDYRVRQRQERKRRAHVPGTPTAQVGGSLRDAWQSLRAATPPGWLMGRPGYNPERRVWELYAYDTTADSQAGLREREWTAIAESEEGVVREMARCLAEIKAGRVPR